MRRYPKHYPNRKSPVRHTVRSHTRAGSRVTSYVRGKGHHSTQTFTRRRLIGKPKAYTINFTYSKRKGDGESVVVIASSYEKALAEGFEERKDGREPIEIEIIDPDLGRVFRAIGTGATKLTKIGAKYAVRGGHIAKQAAIKAAPHLYKGAKKGVSIAAKAIKVTGKVAAEELAKSYASWELNRLIEDCYHENRVKRTRARAKLKRLYPDVYDVADFSKDRPHVPVVPVEVRVRAEKLPRKRVERRLPPAKVPPETIQVYEEKRKKR